REDLALELLSQLRDEGRNFIELVREHSKHPTAARGGAIGAVLRRDLNPAVAPALRDAQAGEVVGPVATPQGMHLLLVEEVKPAELNERLAEIIRAELFDEWLEQQLQGVQ